MKVAVTGATGFVGHAVTMDLLGAGHEVTALGSRRPAHPKAGFLPFHLGERPPPLEGLDALVHAAFSHVPGRYRGGEGNDPEGFQALNLDGSLKLFRAAATDGIARILFLSSRAVYGDYPPGTSLGETLDPRPDTLYGEVKLKAEHALGDLRRPGLAVASVRPTGIYGPPVPGRPHKWRELFNRFDRNEPIPAAIGTEVHAADLSVAIRLLLEAVPAALDPQVFNVSDFILDRRDLLAAYMGVTGMRGRLPPRSDPAGVSVMTTHRLEGLGWRARGPGELAATVRQLAGTP